MNIEKLSEELQAEIAQRQVELSMLKTVLETLLKLSPPTAIDGRGWVRETVTVAPSRGRPRGSTKSLRVPIEASREKTVSKKRNLSPEGRARIAAAVKARWAKQKKAQKKVG